MSVWKSINQIYCAKENKTDTKNLFKSISFHFCLSKSDSKLSVNNLKVIGQYCCWQKTTRNNN